MKNDKDNDKYMKNDKYRQRQECGRLSENVGECQYSLWLLHYWLLCLGELLNAVHDCSAILRQDWLQLLSYSKSTHSSYLSIKWYGGRGRLNINQGLVAAMSVPSVYINPHATITDAPRPTRKKDALKDDAQLSYSNSTQCFSQMLFEDNDLVYAPHSVSRADNWTKLW